PVRTEARVLAAAAFFAKHIRRAYRGHLDFEQRLNCLLYFGLGRVGSHIEDQRAFILLHSQSLFSDQRATDYGIGRRHYAASFSAALRLEALFFSASVNCSI